MLYLLRPLCQSIGLCALFCAVSFAQTNALSFRPVDADYSTALDRMVMASANPNQLHIYNPATNSDAVITLPGAPLRVRVSPDGMHAAVAMPAAVAYVNLSSAAVEKTFAVSTAVVDLVVTSDYIFAFPGIAINIATGANTAVPTAGNTVKSARLHPSGKKIYAADLDFPLSFFDLDISAGPTTGFRTSSFFGYLGCPPIWISSDGLRVYNACATVYFASDDPKQDMSYAGSFSNITKIVSLSESASLKKIALIPGPPDYNPGPILADTQVELRESDYFKVTGRFALPDFQAGGKAYAAHGKWVFFNAGSSALYVIEEADATSGLVSDFAIQTLPLSAPAACGAAFTVGTANISAAGSTGNVGITAAKTCQFRATSSVDWIQIISGGYGSGDSTLAYAVRANTGGASRSGSVSIAGQTLTIMQAAAPPLLPAMGQLAYKIVDAEYSKGLDRVISVSTGPDELHIYDPIAQKEQTVVLSLAPIAVSVRPDGLQAAVAHDGWVTLVDLQTAAVTLVLRLPAKPTDILFAGNGFIYVFSTYYDGDIYTIDLSTNTISRARSYYSGQVARLHPSRPVLYGADGTITEYDLVQNVPVLSSNLPPPAPNTCGNFWLSEDGTRFLTACAKVYKSSSVQADNGAYLGTFPDAILLRWAATSSTRKQTALIVNGTDPAQFFDQQVGIYADDSFTRSKSLLIPDFTVASSPVLAHGRYVFWNSDSSKLVVIAQADPSASLQADYGITILASDSPGLDCSKLTLGPAPVGIVPAAGGSGSVAVNISESCPWIATSSNVWIGLTPNVVAFGPQLLQYVVTINPAVKQRSGTVTVFDKSFTLTQAATGGVIAVAPTSVDIGAGGGTGSINITTNSSTYEWTASVQEPWISIGFAAHGTGTGSLPYSVAPNPTTSARNAVLYVGDFAITFTQAAGPGVVANPGLRFVPVTPCRVVDTRDFGKIGYFGIPEIEANTSRDYPFPLSGCGLPATALAYAVNVTVVPVGPLSYLTIWPTGKPQPFVSTLNSFDGRIVANAAIVPAGTNGSVSVFVTNRTDVIIDVNGYFDAVTPGSLSFYSALPCRIADTRLAAGPFGGPTMTAASDRDFRVPESACSIPASAQAYSMNVTVAPLEALYYLTAWPTGQSRPTVSTLNSFDGSVVANAAILPAGQSGGVRVGVTGKTEVILDVNGYFAPPGAANGLQFYPVTPCRVTDTRSGSGQSGAFGAPSLAANSVRDIPIPAGVCGIPANAKAYSLNVTVDPHGHGLSYLSLWPTGQAQPFVSTLNSFSGKVLANAAIVPAGANGSVSVYVTDPTDVILDINGYFAP